MTRASRDDAAELAAAVALLRRRFVQRDECGVDVSEPAAVPTTSVERLILTWLVGIACVVGSLCWATVGSGLIPGPGGVRMPLVLLGALFAVTATAAAFTRARMAGGELGRGWMVTMVPATLLCVFLSGLSVLIRTDLYGFTYRLPLIAFVMCTGVLAPLTVCAATWNLHGDEPTSPEAARRRILVISSGLALAVTVALVVLDQV